MRSRYSAYVIGAVEYLLMSWHPTTRPKQLELSQPPIQWLGLRIRHTSAGGIDASEGTVEFVARYKIHDKAQRLCELSQFIKEHGRWYYLDGKQLDEVNR